MRGRIQEHIRSLLRVHEAELLRMKDYFTNQLHQRESDAERANIERTSGAQLWIEAIDWVIAQQRQLDLFAPFPESSSKTDVERRIGAITFAAFADEYLQYVKNSFAQKTLDNAERVVNLFMRDHATKPLTDFTVRDLEDFKVRRIASGVSRTTINIDIRTLKAMFAVAAKWHHIEINPFGAVKQLRIDAQPKRTLTHQEYVLLTSAVKEHWLRNIFDFAVLTGLRLGEIRNLTWADYSTSRSEITVRSREGYRVKGGKMRTIPLGVAAGEVVQHLPRVSEFMFTDNHGRRYTANYISRKFRVYIRLVHLPREVHFHRLRDTFCTWLAEAGVPVHVIKTLAGHSSLRTTEGYITSSSDYIRSEVDKVHLPLQ